MRPAKALSRELSDRLWTVMHAPEFDLALKIGQFQPPFEYLKAVIPGFSPDVRFILNGVLDRDADAIAVRDFEIEWQMGRLHNKWISPPGGDDPLRAYLSEHEDEYRTFLERHYPWYSESVDADDDSFAPEPNLDEAIDAIVLSVLADYGFSASLRKARKSWWRCRSDLLRYPLVLEFEKTPMSLTMNGRLIIEAFDYQAELASPFFFSKSDFLYASPKNVKRQMTLFFEEYGKVFPHVLTALEKSINAAEELLQSQS